MKLILILLGLINGIYMLVDGLFVMLKGKYIGPEKPGPWAYIFSKMQIDVFKLGPLFILLGFLWIAWVYSFWTNQSWSYLLGLSICVCTIWYLPFGTIISLIIIISLIFAKQKLGV